MLPLPCPCMNDRDCFVRGRIRTPVSICPSRARTGVDIVKTRPNPSRFSGPAGYAAALWEHGRKILGALQFHFRVHLCVRRYQQLCDDVVAAGDWIALVALLLEEIRGRHLVT